MIERIVRVAVLGLLGCSGGGDRGVGASETELGLVADAPGEGSAVYLEGSLEADALMLTLWARGAGEVFGVAAHVVHESASIAVDADAPLGSELEARHVVVERDGDVSIGGTRLSPELGDIAIDEPIRLATLRLERPAGPASYRVERVTVRRSDGSFVPTTAFGAAVIEREVAR